MLPILATLCLLGGIEGQSPDSVQVKADPPGEVLLQERTVRAASPTSPGTVWRLDRKELEAAGGLGAALDRVPGVEIRTRGGLGGWTVVSLRGSPAGQVEVTLDGVPLGGSAGQTVDLGGLSEESLDRVEVRQATGPDAHGVARIDLVTRKAWARTGVDLSAGSFGQRQISTQTGSQDGALAASGWWESADNDWPFPWDGGTRWNILDDEVRRLHHNASQNFGGSASWRMEQWDLHMEAQNAVRQIDGPLLANPKAQWERSAFQASLIDHGSVGWKFHARRFLSNWKDSGGGAYWSSDINAREEGWDIGGSGKWPLSPWASWEPILAAKVRWEQSERVSEGRTDVALTPSAWRTTAGGEAGLRRAWSKFGASATGDWNGVYDRQTSIPGNLVGQIRPDSSHLSNALSWNARFWATFELGEMWTAISWRERPPEFAERLGDNGVVLSNWDIAAEKATQFEVGGSLQPKNRFWKITSQAFFARYQRPIVLEPLGNSPIGQYKNGEGNDHYGLETSMWACSPAGALQLRSTLQKTLINDPNPSLDGKELPRIPNWKIAVSVSSPVWRGWSTGYDLDLQGRSWENALNDPQSTEPRRILQGVWLRWIQGAWSAFGAVRNLGDDHFEDYRDAPLSGRSYEIRLAWHWMKSSKGEQ